jgi:hypothetical protein
MSRKKVIFSHSGLYPKSREAKVIHQGAMKTKPLEGSEFQFVYLCSPFNDTVYNKTKWFQIAGLFI